MASEDPLPRPGSPVWRPPHEDRPAAERLAASAGIPELLARLLLRRGVMTAEAARSFLEPALADLHDPFLMKGLAAAVDRLLAACDAGERVVIYGDYDVDGLTAVAQLRAALSRLGADAVPFIPHRLRDGYGLKVATVDRALELEPAVLVTVDCGISAVEGVRRVAEAGVFVIVTDHHLPPEALPERCVILNPKQPGCDYPWKELCGAGVAFKLVQALALRRPKLGDVSAYLRVAALGTVADMVPLGGENRVISRLGALGLANPRSPGLRALLSKIGVLGRMPTSHDLGFRIGPRLNAAGRIDVATRALELLETRDEAAALALADELDRLNTERQKEERAVTELARAAAFAAGDPADRAALVLSGPGWHRGVLGISASRIARELHRPVILLSTDGETATGSGRSIPGIHLHAALETLRPLLREFGGHAAAIGLTMNAADVPELAERLDAEIRRSAPPGAFVEVHEPDLEVTVGELAAADALAILDRLEPCGVGNTRPLFLLRRVRTARTREIAAGRGISGRIRTDRTELPFVAWGAAELDRRFLSSGALDLDLLGEVERDDWAGGFRFRIVAVRESEAAC